MHIKRNHIKLKVFEVFVTKSDVFCSQQYSC